MKRAWLSPFEWSVVVDTNRRLCLPKHATHKATSEGHEPARLLWESCRHEDMSLAEVAELCRRCHLLAPFCNFNGNTFATVIRLVVSGLGLPEADSLVLRSLAGHIVAGVATQEERTAFAEFIDRLATRQPNETDNPA